MSAGPEAGATTGAQPADAAPSPTHRYRPGHATFPGLDGLRALAVLAVVTTHTAFTTGRYERGWGNNALARLDAGVAVFFVLSGFLLVRPWLVASATGGPRPSVRTYAVRRVARIMPAYLVAVALALVLLPGNAGASAWDWVRHILLVQIYQAGWLRPGLTQTWSLSTEVAFYVLLPLIGAGILFVGRHRWRPTLLLAVLSLGIVLPLPWYYLVHHVSGEAWRAAGFWLPGFGGWFAGGMAMAVIRTHLDHRSPSPSSRWRLAEELGARPMTCWLMALVIYFVAMTPIAGPRSIVVTTTAESVTKQTLYLAVACALVWPAVFGRSAVTDAVLGNPVMRYLGDISYGVFLYHLVVLQGVMALLDQPLWTGRIINVLPLTLMGSATLAALSFRFLEHPIIGWAHRPRPERSPWPRLPRRREPTGSGS